LATTLYIGIVATQNVTLLFGIFLYCLLFFVYKHCALPNILTIFLAMMCYDIGYRVCERFFIQSFRSFYNHNCTKAIPIYIILANKINSMLNPI